MALHDADQVAISSLRRSDVELTLAGLKRFFGHGRWLSRDNRYVIETTDRLKDDVRLGVLNQRNVAQYISASTVLHANDGWSYLGRAIGSLLSGDAHRAFHLAYYAELRAGMSLLASSGIGIFSKQHFIVIGPNAAAKLRVGAGTHADTWDILEHWSKEASSGALFAELVRPDGETLADWFRPVGGVGALEAQARNWFLQWGMDLNIAIEDRNARNESSYRPDGIPNSWGIASDNTFEFIQALWDILEPRPNSSFQEVDRYILRMALERHHESVTGRKARATDPAFLSLIRNVVGPLYADETATRWIDFLLRRTAPQDPAIFAKSGLKPGKPATDHLAIISRAVLLLRMATGSAENLLEGAGIVSADLSFWWEAIGETRGLWPAGSPPAQRGDLWRDIEDTLSDVAAIIARTPNTLQSLNSVRSDMAGYLDVLCTHERVGLWGLCP